ncbi:FmdE family protein [Clostridiaceae bacterium M8S5]|nr:FmdE family protein [Clostridiaceae bacterium M8S5]
MWDKCVEFHGHECPGLAIGLKVSQAVISKMNIKFSLDEEIVCVTENDTCAVDAIQVLIGCTFGKGNLIFKDTGKMVFNFYNRTNNYNIKISLKPMDYANMNRNEKIKYILQSNIEEIFNFSETTAVLPEKAKIYNTVICDKCEEGVAENKVYLVNDKNICTDCYIKYQEGVSK